MIAASASAQIVTNTHDRGTGSLRDAIAMAPDGGTITFGPSVIGSITLTSPLDIEKNLTIRGPVAGVLTVSGNHVDRVFLIGQTRPDISVTLSGLVIADGHVELLLPREEVGGAGILSGARTLTIADCVIAGNSVSVAEQGQGEGGGIYYNGTGTLTIAGSAVVGNSMSGGLEGFGGGIYYAGSDTLNVVDSVVSGNSVSSVGGGGGGSDGGGIINVGNGTVNVRNSTISGNSVNGVGGFGFGGGIYNNNMGTVNIVDSTLSGNTAAGNAAFGGAINSGTSGAGTVTVNSSTIFGNAAKGCDSGCGSCGGGIYVSGGTTTITNVTIAGNTASGTVAFAGGICEQHTVALVNIGNTIVANNSTQGATTRGPDVLGEIAFSSQGYNLIGNGDGARGFDAVKHDHVGSTAAPVDPLLDPAGLQDNGGPTLTVAVLAGSPAIDQGSPATDPVTGQPVTTDQRGFPRPVADLSAPGPYPGDRSDIGAFEHLSASHPAISAAAIALAQGSRSTKLQIATVSEPDQSASTLTVAVVAATGSGVTVSNVSIDAGGQVLADVATSCAATSSTFALTVTDGSASASATLVVTVGPNTPPVIGSYPATFGPINPGATTVVPASAAPADNGTVVLTASAPGFGGTVSVSSATGLVAISRAKPPGTHTVTVTATDNCGLTSTETFTLLVNQPPSIVAPSISLQEGTLPSAAVKIADVHDAEDPPAALRATVNGGTNATVRGVTLSQIAVGPDGAVRANLVAVCGASSHDFALTVTDRGGLSTNATLLVSVPRNTPPALGIYPSSVPVRRGASTTILPSHPPTDNGVVTGIAVFGPGFGGGLAVNPSTGAVTVSNARPVGTYSVTVKATDNCSATIVRSFLLRVRP